MSSRLEVELKQSMVTHPLTAVALGLVGGIVAVGAEGARQGDSSTVVNAGVAIAAVATPTALEVTLRPSGARGAFGPELFVWVAAAGFLHSAGMLRLYESTWWWDHLTHTVSAGLVAALVYAALVVGRSAAVPWLPSAWLGAATVAVVFAVGMLWEALEVVARAVGERYGVEPVLVHYGRRDAALDLAFNLVGAVAVVAIDLRLFVASMARLSGLGAG